MSRESRLRLRAPAKINLFLRVVGKRPDGFHELETIFERIDLADELTFEAAPVLSLTCSDPNLSCGEGNLVLKAARLLQKASGTSQGAKIHLTKRIPIAAGLGGGSSDAAAALQGLNRLWKLQWPKGKLIELAAQLGSDVPFFLYDVPFAIGRGRGERCEPIEGQPLAHVLVVPDTHLSTKEIYGALNLPLTAPPSSISMVAHALRNGPDLAGLATGLWNDLEAVAIRRCPVITQIQGQLRAAECLSTRLSGSGPSVFGLCRDRAHAHQVATTLRAHITESWRIEFVQTEPPVTT